MTKKEYLDLLGTIAKSKAELAVLVGEEQDYSLAARCSAESMAIELCINLLENQEFFETIREIYIKEANNVSTDK